MTIRRSCHFCNASLGLYIAYTKQGRLFLCLSHLICHLHGYASTHVCDRHTIVHIALCDILLYFFIMQTVNSYC